MKLKILHLSLLFAATTAKDVYVEGATTDSPGAAAVVPAAKLGANESANYEYDEDAATDSPGAEAVVPAAKLNGVKNEALAANHRRMWDSYGPSCGIGISHCASECIDTDNGAVDVDPWNDACKDYIGNTHWCGNYDDNDFTSNTMCCACGGGRLVWGELKDNHVDGCRRGGLGFFGTYGTYLLDKCNACEGDCDTDADCGFGLRCFQRDGYTPVPSCKGTGKHDWDYCTWLW